MNKKEDVFQHITFSRRERTSIMKDINKYQIDIPDYINTEHKSIAIVLGADFVSNLSNFFNNDVLLNACICKHTERTYKKKLSYYLEIFYTKLMTCWEYLFVYLNEYLKTGLFPNEQTKNDYIERQMYEQVMIQYEDHFKIQRIPHSAEEQMRLRKELKKELVVLSNPNVLKQRINSMYEESEIINNIFSCYSDEIVIDAKHIRNLILHSDSIQKNYSLGIDDLFGGIAIRTRDVGFYDKLVNKIDDNIKLLRKALLLFKELVYEDKVPNHIENSGIRYIVYDYVCKMCKETIVVPDRLEDVVLEGYRCPKCGYKEFSKKQQAFQVSEVFYGTQVGNLLEETM